MNMRSSNHVHYLKGTVTHFLYGASINFLMSDLVFLPGFACPLPNAQLFSTQQAADRSLILVTVIGWILTVNSLNCR